jgi:hypothetical protein
MSKTKKEFAPSIKLYKNDKGNYGANIKNKNVATIQELLKRADEGARLVVKPVSEAYKATCKGSSVPEYELTIYTKAEMAAFSERTQAEESF